MFFSKNKKAKMFYNVTMDIIVAGHLSRRHARRCSDFTRVTLWLVRYLLSSFVCLSVCPSQVGVVPKRLNV